MLLTMQEDPGSPQGAGFRGVVNNAHHASGPKFYAKILIYIRANKQPTWSVFYDIGLVFGNKVGSLKGGGGFNNAVTFWQI
jgi:hypothetical protein